MSNCNNCKNEEQCQQYCINCIKNEIKNTKPKKSPNDNTDYNSNLCNKVRNKYDPNHYCPYDEFEHIDSSKVGSHNRGCNMENFEYGQFTKFSVDDIPEACKKYKAVICNSENNDDLGCCMGVDKCGEAKQCFDCNDPNIINDATDACGTYTPPDINDDPSKIAYCKARNKFCKGYTNNCDINKFGNKIKNLCSNDSDSNSTDCELYFDRNASDIKLCDFMSPGPGPGPSPGPGPGPKKKSLGSSCNKNSECMSNRCGNNICIKSQGGGGNNGDGIPVGVWIGLGVALLVLLIVIGFILKHHKKTIDMSSSMSSDMSEM